MFQLRSEQMAAFGQASLETFEDRVAADLRRIWPDRTTGVSDPELARRIHEGVERAGQYGLTTEFELACFAEAAVVLGPRFDVDPRRVKVYRLLRNKEVPPRRKAVALCRYTHRQ